jgi:hypothetical protein
MGLAQKLGALLLMAVETDCGLRIESQHRVIGRVHIMAIDTGDRFQVMGAAWPVQTSSIFVTTQAFPVFVFNRGFVVELHRRRQAGTVSQLFHMVLGGAVAGLALVLALAKG